MQGPTEEAGAEALPGLRGPGSQGQVQDVQRPSDWPVPHGRTRNRGAGLGAGPRRQGGLSPDEVTPTLQKEPPAGFEKPGEEGKVVVGGRRGEHPHGAS